MRLGEEIGDRSRDRRADALDIVELGEGLALPLSRRRAHRLEEGFGRAVVAREQPRRGLADMANAERIDEAVEPDIAARLDGVEEIAAPRVSPQPSRSASFDDARLSRLASVKISGGDWIRPSS